MKTKAEITIREPWPVYGPITIPAGAPVEPATNQPGKQFWVLPWPGISEQDYERVTEGVGVLLRADEVTA